MATVAETLKRLSIERGRVKKSVTDFHRIVDDTRSQQDQNILTRAGIIKLELRLEKILPRCDEFMGIHNQICDLNKDDDDDELLAFEENYFDVIASAKEIIEAFSMSEDKIIDTDNDSSHSSIHSNNSQAMGRASIKLPTIQLPKFFGDYSSWLEFKDTFDNLIHKNDALGNIQKFFYLKSSLGGDARQTIQNMETSADNYDVIWANLCERYQNKRLLVQNHIREIHNLPAMGKESSAKIRYLLDKTNQHLRALATLNQPVKYWDAMIIYITCNKLDSVTLREWEASNVKCDIPTWDELREFLRNKADMLETIGPKIEFKEKKYENKNHNPSTSNVFASANISCYYCKGGHSVYGCSDFLALSVKARKNEVKKLSLCANCLRPGHFAAKCSSFSCRQCSGKHNSLLHEGMESESSNSVSESAPVVSMHNTNATKYTLLSTAVVEAFNLNNKKYNCRVLLDCGSQSNFITKSTAELLQLTLKPVSVRVGGVNGCSTQIKENCILDFKSRTTDYSDSVECLIVPQISGCLPQFEISTVCLNIPASLKLADPNYAKPRDVDILLGAGVFWKLLTNESISLGKGMPDLRGSLLGWIVSGPVPIKSRALVNAIKCYKSTEIHDDLTRFWEIEDFPSEMPVSDEEAYCEAHFIENHSRDVDGRFTVGIPLKLELNKLGNSRSGALKRYLSLERKLIVNEDLRKEYKSFMNEKTKTLGLYWSSDKDYLSYEINMPSQENVTKRSILSAISKIFDPLGLLGACIVIAKIMMQSRWQAQLDWDTAIPDSIAFEWIKFSLQLNKLNDIKIPRQCITSDAQNIQLHGFADASEKAYGACIYLRTISKNGDICIHILCSKSKVAPLKTLTIPKLELCAALTLAKLVKRVKDSMRIEFNAIYLWSDSTIVLAWLKRPVNMLKIFVANRVIKIIDLIGKAQWFHVPTKDNPADLISRGVLPSDILNSIIWWHGPWWLKHDAVSWPIQINELIDGDVPELRNSVNSYNVYVKESVIDCDRFSNYSRLIRTFAYVLRFAKGHAYEKNSNLMIGDVKNAELRLIKLIQVESFKTDYEALKGKIPLKRKSILLSLSPFIDDKGLIRVGGRLKNSDLCYESKHPLLLPTSHRFTKLLFEYEHKRLGHAGPQQLLFSIRERFWPIRGKNIARNCVHRCTTCFKVNPRNSDPKMGDLPKARVTQSFPFETTGVDFASPFTCKDRKGRGAKTRKCYISLFICFSCKANHLELVSDLSTEAFIAALRRFISRRGKPNVIWSDNGTNFKGANNELVKIVKELKLDESMITSTLITEGIEWKFIPVNSPHFGGLWEAGVKGAKFHLKRIIGDACLTFEELSTVCCQIEAMMNSRPLMSLSNDPNDIQALTPGHFLIGRALTSLPDRELVDEKMSHLSRFELLQRLCQQFWKQWSNEYLRSLQPRSKWKVQQLPLSVGTLVLIRDDNLPPLKWPLGKIVELHQGADGISRVATVLKQGGRIKRAVCKLFPLPCEM